MFAKSERFSPKYYNEKAKTAKFQKEKYRKKNFLERKFSMLPTKWVASLASFPFLVDFFMHDV